MANEGQSRETIIEKLEADKQRMSINLTVDSLEYLRRGGRLTHAKAAIASVLDIRPIIALVDGKLEAVGKARGRKKSIEFMLSNIPKEVKEISICHTVNPVEAEQVSRRVAESFPKALITVEEIGQVIGAHLGPKAIGICCSW